MSTAIERPLKAIERPELDQCLNALAAAGKATALVGLFEAFIHAADAMSAFSAQPRISDNDEAEDLLSSESGRMFELAEAVIYHLERMPFLRDDWDRHLRTATLVRWDLECGERSEVIAATLLKAEAFGATAEYRGSR